MNINPGLLELLEQESLLFNSPYHGLYHWQTVERNGLYLTEFTKADPMVVSYFSYLHDCQRVNEFEDPQHGPRGAKFAKKHRTLFDLSEEQFDKLCFACSGHTFGQKSICPSILTCWDADRLDIGRVGITPDSQYLFSDEAKRIADQGDFGVLY